MFSSLEVVRQGPTGFFVSRGFPRRAAPLSKRGRSNNRASSEFGLVQNLADFLRVSDIMSKLDARRAMTSERGPKPEHHPTSLEEANLTMGSVRVFSAPSRRSMM